MYSPNGKQSSQWRGQRERPGSRKQLLKRPRLHLRASVAPQLISWSPIYMSSHAHSLKFTLRMKTHSLQTHTVKTHQREHTHTLFLSLFCNQALHSMTFLRLFWTLYFQANVFQANVSLALCVCVCVCACVLYVCVVCVLMCMCVCVCVYMFECVGVFMCLCYMLECVCVCLCVCVCSCAYAIC